MIEGSLAAQGARKRGVLPLIRKWFWLFVIVAGWGALVAWELRTGVCYTTDSASYFECARNMAAGKPWTQRSYVAPDQWRPLAMMWPPGYPLLLAGLLRIGVPLERGCLLIALLSGAISTLALARIVRCFLRPLVTMGVLLAVVSMEGYARSGIAAMSDGPYLALTATAIALLCHADSQTRRVLLVRLSLAGLLIGLSWSVRYVGALLILVASSYVLAEALSHRQQTALRLTAWGGGLLAGGGPLVLHNLIKYREVLPYSMPHSTRSLTRNVPEALGVIAEALTASATVGKWCGTWLGLGLVATVGAGLLTHFHRPLLRALCYQPKARLALFLAVYGIAYVGAIILSRSYYELWGGVNPRFMVQIYWIVWLAVGTTLCQTFANQRLLRPRAALACTVLLMLMAVRLGWHTTTTISEEATRPTVTARRLWRHLADAVPPDQVIFSCRADLCRIFADVNARAIEPETVEEDLLTFRTQGKLWGVVIEDLDGAARGDYGATIRRLASTENTAVFHPIWSEDGGRIFRYTDPAAGAPSNLNGAHPPKALVQTVAHLR